MTHDKLSAIRDTLNRRADVLAAMPPSKASYGLDATFDRQRAARVRKLRDYAPDAQAALDGCPESLASVEAFVASDPELSLAMPSRARAVVLRTEPFGLRPVGLSSLSQGAL